MLAQTLICDFCGKQGVVEAPFSLPDNFFRLSITINKKTDTEDFFIREKKLDICEECYKNKISKYINDIKGRINGY